jgi:hypothetical protein
VCDQSPQPSCVDAKTLRTYDAQGVCQSGTCEYASHDVACANCPNCDSCSGITCNQPPSVCFAATGTCSGGACSYAFADGASCDDGDACTVNETCAKGVCAGIPKACSTPPPPTCTTPTTLRSFSASGSCTGGTCNYPPTDTTCAGGCQSGACAPPPRYVFVIGDGITGYTGNIGNRSGANAECQAWAMQAGLAGTYAAILGYSTASPKDYLRLDQHRPIVLPSGKQVATDDTFWSATHLLPINEYPDKNPTSEWFVWTNFDSAGNSVVSMSSPNCADWTSDYPDNGQIGNVTNSNWAHSGSNGCSATNLVYCIQQ